MVMRCCICENDSPSGNWKVLGSDCTVRHSGSAQVLELGAGPVAEVALDETGSTCTGRPSSSERARRSPSPARAVSCRWRPAAA